MVVWSNNVTIGGTANGAGNIIANNTSDGIRLVFDVDHNSFLSNSIYNNGGLGINFGNGPTPNHDWPPGVTSGPNLFQNYPVLGTVTSSAGNTTITGTLNAAPNTQFLVQFFASPTADPSGYGQGQIYLGSTMVTTDGTSNAAFNATLSGVSVPGGYAVTATATDPLGDTSEFAKDVSTQNVADLGITGQISESPAYIGDTVTYTFTITNAGPDTGHGVTFTDTLPAGVNYADGFSSVPAGMTPIVSGNSITVNVGTLAAGATVTLMFQAQITTGAASSITNTGSVTTTDSDPTTPDTAPVTTTVLPSADLAITQLTTTPAPNYAGANLVYTIAAANNGPSDATGVMVVDTLPANVMFISATGGATFDGTSKVTLNVGNLASGGTATFTITVQPTAAAVAASPISDSATASANEHDSNTSNNTLTVSTTIVASADLQVGISPSASPVDAGQNLTYTITATNNGPSDATGVVVTDTIPADVTFVSATGGATPDGTGKITFPNFTLAAGASATFLVTVTALGTSASPTSDSATVSANEHDPNTANNTISVSVPVTPISDLSVGLTATTSAYVGDQVTYMITAANTGPSTEPAAVVTDTLPANVAFVSATGGVTPDGSGKLTFNLGSLASGATPVTLTIVVVAQPAAAGTIMNTASITGQNVDHTVGNKSSTKSTTITPSADLAVDVTASSSSLLVDQNLVYTITATNNGPSSATGVTVVDTLPATPKDVKFLSATGGVMPDSNNKLTFNVGNLASGATVTYTVTVQPTVAAPTDSPLNNSATIAGNEHDPNTGNNTSQFSTAVLPAVDLAIVTFTGSPGTLEIGHQLTYTTDRHQPRPVAGDGRHPFKPPGQRGELCLGQRHPGLGRSPGIVRCGQLE